jgi:hypothetical protein
MMAVIAQAGRELVVDLLSGQRPAAASVRFLRAWPHGEVSRAAGLLVLTLSGDRISAMTHFGNGVLPGFGLPRMLPALKEPAGDMGRPGQALLRHAQGRAVAAGTLPGTAAQLASRPSARRDGEPGSAL